MADKRLVRMFWVGRSRVYLYERDRSRTPYGVKIASGKIAWVSSQTAVDKKIRKLRAEFSHGKRAYHSGERFATVVCACGCNTTFTATFTTRPPAYLNADHRSAARRARQQEKRAAEKKRQRAAERARRKEEREHARVSSETQPARREGRGGGRGRGRGGVSPSRMTGADAGLFAADPEPVKSQRRRRVGLPTGGSK